MNTQTQNYSHEFTFTIKYIAMNDVALRNALRKPLKNEGFKAQLKHSLALESEKLGRDISKSTMDVSVINIVPMGKGLNNQNKHPEFFVHFKCQIRG